MRKKRRLGVAFSDEIEKVFSSSKHKNYSGDNASSWKDGLITNNRVDSSTPLLNPWRKIILLCVFLFIFFGVFLRLFDLQVVQGEHLRELADSNRIKIKVIHAPRGVIYDRFGKVLAENEPGFRLIEKDASNPGKLKISFISRDDALKMEVRNDPRFKDLEVDSVRTYPMGEATAHVLGYLGEINDTELNSSEFGKYDPSTNLNGYKIGDQIGRSGVEETYEKTLRGVDGGQIIEVDAQGNPVQTLSETDPIPGQNLYLTIDAGLQEVLYKNLVAAVKNNKSCCGAAVAEDPNTGEVLALVSYPSYDPKNLVAALTGANSPLLDRAIGGAYPPGSTFKIATSLAGLSSGKITPQTTFEDTGIMNLGPYTFANWYYTEYGKKELGPVDIVRAIQRSNDIFFYHVGQTVGEGAIGDAAKKLGLGQVLGIDIPGEVPGLIPTDAWKKKNIGVDWYPGDTLHMAIGQGYVLATPLQVLNMTSAIAANGKEYPPHLALKFTSPGGRTVKQFKFNPVTIAFSPDQISLVQQGLKEVPLNGGTAWPFFTFPIKTAGKTGTAEFGTENKTHAWYTSYAPADNPKIALTVLVEGAGEGSNVSAPVAKEVYRWYFSKDKNNLLKDITIAESTESAKTLGE